MRKSPRKKAMVTFNLEPELVERIDRLAQTEARTRSSCIRWLVLRELDRIAAEQSAQPASSAA